MPNQKDPFTAPSYNSTVAISPWKNSYVSLLMSWMTLTADGKQYRFDHACRFLRCPVESIFRPRNHSVVTRSDHSRYVVAEGRPRTLWMTNRARTLQNWETSLWRCWRSWKMATPSTTWMLLGKLRQIEVETTTEGRPWSRCKKYQHRRGWSCKVLAWLIVQRL